MTRRLFFLSLLPLGQSSEQGKFYVTGGKLTTDGTPRDDCQVPALIAYGRDKMDALARSGLQVWTAAEYFRKDDRIGKAPCRQK